MSDKLNDSGIIRLQNYVMKRTKYLVWAAGIFLAVASAWFTLKFDVKANQYRIEQLEKRVDKLEEIWK